MNLKQFKQQLQQLEDKLLNEYNLTDEEVEVNYLDSRGDNYFHYVVEDLKIETKYNEFWNVSSTTSTIIELS